MGFGNFKIKVIILILLFSYNQKTIAWQETETTKFLYDQLDYFLENPSSSGLLRLSKLVTPKENLIITSSDRLAWVIVHANMGYYHHQFSNIPGAILHYEKAWKIYNDTNLQNYDIIENCLQPLGNLYIKLGDLPKAEKTITSYLYMAEQSKNTLKVVAALTNLSVAYNNQGNYTGSIDILKKGLALAPTNVNILTNLATNHLEIGEIEIAEDYANKVLIYDPDQVNAYQILARIALTRKNLKQAENYILKAQSHLFKDAETTARDIAKWQLAYVDILLEKAEFKEAQLQLKKIYSILIPQYSTQNDFPNPKQLIADKILLNTLDTHAYTYQQLDIPLLAVAAYQLAFKVHSKLNLLYPLQDTKLIQHTQNHHRAERYIHLLYELFIKTGEQQYIEQAFEAAETTKAPVVSEALLSKKYIHTYQNDSLVTRIKNLQQELSILDTNILKEKQKGSGARISKIQEWIILNRTKNIELSKMISTLQDKYPALLPLHQKTAIPSLQKKLGKEGVTIIEYFFGKNSVFRFIISGTSFEMYEIKNAKEFRLQLIEYIAYFSNPSVINNDLIGFAKCSYKTFTMLNVPKDANKILIIPDGLLNFIPFETLLTKEANTISFDQMPFWIHTAKINYEISTNKYITSSSNIKENKTVLGIFPVFEDTPQELPNSLLEKKWIQQNFDGTFLEKKEAIFSTFCKEANQHDILHFSTHADAGNLSRSASIKFRDQNILVNELYGMSLTSNLVVLSACETGIGKIVHGEGPLSIGRGFQYAGVENILFSLWKVNDKTTSQIMNMFYKNMRDFQSVNSSLHQAKLDYLQSDHIDNAQKSPYYWAAFVYYGKIEPIAVSNSIWIYGIPVFIIIILLLLRICQKRI